MSASSGRRPALPLTALQRRIGYLFQDVDLLDRARTHRSFGADHYERLEFLGDAVLNLAVSDLLYQHFGSSDEGGLTRIRAHLVRQDTLHKLAIELKLPEVLQLSEGEARGGGAQRPSILADAVEAIIGAVYLDGGFQPARDLVVRLFTPLVEQTTVQTWSKDAKTELQEWLQARKHPVPDYRIESTQGQAHEQVFVVICEIPSQKLAERGEGRSRRAAEQEAARAALARLKQGGRA